MSAHRPSDGGKRARRCTQRLTRPQAKAGLGSSQYRTSPGDDWPSLVLRLLTRGEKLRHRLQQPGLCGQVLSVVGVELTNLQPVLRAFEL